jgi:hypothetical protein
MPTPFLYLLLCLLSFGYSFLCKRKGVLGTPA